MKRYRLNVLGYTAGPMFDTLPAARQYMADCICQDKDAYSGLYTVNHSRDHKELTIGKQGIHTYSEYSIVGEI